MRSDGGGCSPLPQPLPRRREEILYPSGAEAGELAATARAPPGGTGALPPNCTAPEFSSEESAPRSSPPRELVRGVLRPARHALVLRVPLELAATETDRGRSPPAIPLGRCARRRPFFLAVTVELPGLVRPVMPGGLPPTASSHGAGPDRRSAADSLQGSELASMGANPEERRCSG